MTPSLPELPSAAGTTSDHRYPIGEIHRDRRRRGALMMAALTLAAVFQFRTASQSAALLTGEALAIASLMLIGIVLDRIRGRQPGRSVGIGPLVFSLSAAVPLSSRLLLVAMGASASPWEIVSLTTLGVAGMVLAACGTNNRQVSLAVVCSGFLALFTTAISDRMATLFMGIVWVLLCLWWLLANHWERLEVHLAQVVHRPRTLRLSMTLLGLFIVSAVGVLGWGQGLATRSIGRGVMPTSGGREWTDPTSRSGVGDGDAVVAAQNHPVSFGAVESEIFLQSHQPSLFDLFDDTIGKPKRNQKSEKAMGLANQTRLPNRFGTSQSQQGDAGFSIRRQARPPAAAPKDRKTSTMLQWIGPPGERLAIERWDRFDGSEWTRAAASADGSVVGVGTTRGKLIRRELDGRPWFFRSDHESDLAGSVRADGVKIINLRTTVIPAPDRAVGVHIVDIDRQDFFDLDAHGSLYMPGREAIPSLTVIRLVTQLIDADRLASLDVLPGRNRTDDAAQSESRSSAGMELAANLAKRWAAGAATPWGRIEAIVDRLRQDFVFDRSVSSAADDPLLEFLTRRRGGAHLFATAAAVMIRSLGYESRLVGGFYVSGSARSWGSWGFGQSDVKAEDVHNWVEVLVDQDLWVAIEPTPGFEPPARHRSLGSKSLAALVASLPAIGGLATAVLALVWFRQIWGEWLCRLAWAIPFPWSPRQRVTLLIRLLDARGRLAGMRRPPGMTPRCWVRETSAALDSSLRVAADRFFDAADSLFFSPAPPTAATWLADADRLADGLRVRALLHAKSISPTLSDP